MNIKKIARTVGSWAQEHWKELVGALMVLLRVALYFVFGVAASIMAGAVWASTGGKTDSQAFIITIAVAGVFGFLLMRYVTRLKNATAISALGAVSFDPQQGGIGALASDHSEDTLYMVANHEAHHAVVSAALGHKIHSIRTRPKGMSGGNTAYEIDANLSLSKRHWDQALSAAAPVGINSGHQQTDDAALFSHLTQVVGMGVLPYGVEGELTLSNLHSAAIAQSRRIVLANAHAIERLTEELVRDRSIESDRLNELVDELLPDVRKLQDTADGSSQAAVDEDLFIRFQLQQTDRSNLIKAARS